MSIVTKLEKLKADFDSGNKQFIFLISMCYSFQGLLSSRALFKQLADLQGQINALTTTLVRIQGAIAVLEENQNIRKGK